VEIHGVTFAMHNQNVANKYGVQYFAMGMNALSTSISTWNRDMRLNYFPLFIR
jgi:hypothetical protein